MTTPTAETIQTPNSEINSYCDEELALTRDPTLALFLGNDPDAREKLEDALTRVAAKNDDLPHEPWLLLTEQARDGRDNPYYDEQLTGAVLDRSVQLHQDFHLDVLREILRRPHTPVQESFETGNPDMPWVTVTLSRDDTDYNISFVYSEEPTEDRPEPEPVRQVGVSLFSDSLFTKDFNLSKRDGIPPIGLQVRDTAAQDKPIDYFTKNVKLQTGYSEDIAELTDFCLQNAYVRVLSRRNELQDIWDTEKGAWVNAEYGDQAPAAATLLGQLGISLVAEDGTPTSMIEGDARKKGEGLEPKDPAAATHYVPGYGGWVSTEAFQKKVQPLPRKQRDFLFGNEPRTIEPPK